MLRLVSIAAAFIATASSVSLAAAPPFSEFPAGPIARGASIPPDLSDPQAKAFRTRLRDGVKGPANFAGHYSLILWGCGTSCATGAAVDRLNGRVIMLPSVCCTEHWSPTLEPITGHLESRLLIFSGKINEDGPDVEHYFVVDGGGAHEVRSVPFPAEPANASPEQPASGKATGVDCKAITSDLARLDCFDRASGR